MSFFHIGAAAQIEAECFSVPWSRDAIADEMNSGHTHFFIAVEDGEYTGYGCFSAVADEGEIYRVAVLPAFRRRGIAGEILCAMERKAEKLAVQTLFLEVRESNIAARGLYAACGFAETGLRKNYYDNPAENAVLMAKKLPGGPE